MQNVKEKQQIRKSNLQKIISSKLNKQMTLNSFSQMKTKVSCEIKKHVAQKIIYKERKSKINRYNNYSPSPNYESLQSLKLTLDNNLQSISSCQQNDQFQVGSNKQHSKNSNKMNYCIAKTKLISSKQNQHDTYKSFWGGNSKNIILLKPKLEAKRNQRRQKQLSFIENYSTGKIQIKPQSNIQIIQNNEDTKKLQQCSPQIQIDEKHNNRTKKGINLQKQKKIVNIFKVFEESQKNLPDFNCFNKAKQHPIKFRIKPKIKSQSNKFNPTIHQINSIFCQSSTLESSESKLRKTRIETSSLIQSKEKKSLQINQDKMKKQLKTFYNCMRNKKSSTELKVSDTENQLIHNPRKNIKSQKQRTRQKEQDQDIINQYRKLKKQLLSASLKKQQKPKILRQPYSLTNILAYQALQPYLQSMSIHVNYVNRSQLSSKNNKNRQPKIKAEFSQKNLQPTQYFNNNRYHKKTISQNYSKQINKRKNNFQKKASENPNISGWQINDIVYSQQNQICY